MFSYLKDKLSGDDTSQDDDETDRDGHSQGDGQGFLSKAASTLLTTELDDETFEDVFWELELILLENNVAKTVIDALRDDLRESLVESDVNRGGQEAKVKDALRSSIRSVLQEPDTSLVDLTDDHNPLKIVVVGVNGSGKTTTVAKLTKHFQDNAKSCVLAAADTYRAAAIQQLQEHADKLDTKLIKHDYGADPAAVAYDAVQHAESSDKDVCIVDTAGRLHTDDNLMQQLQKIIRVTEPHLTLYVAESVTGNDAVRQLQAFQDHISVNGVIMTKVDADEKGGSVLSVSHVTGAPIYFLGTGQAYDDLDSFDKDAVLDEIGL